MDYMKIVSENIHENGENESQLTLSNLNIGKRDLKIILQLEVSILQNLTILDLWNNRIGAEGAKYLASGVFDDLTNLNLYDNMVGSVGCKYLVDGNFMKLRKLNLWGNHIGVEGVKYFFNGNFSNMTLILYKNNLSNQCCKQLLRIFEQMDRVIVYL